MKKQDWCKETGIGGKVINEYMQRAHGKSQSRVGLRVEHWDGWGGGQWWGGNGNSCTWTIKKKKK